MDLQTVIEGEELEFRDVISAAASQLRPGEPRPGRDIMIAVDHGPKSRQAFDWALVHLCRESDTVHLIHAVSSVKNEVVYDMSKALLEKMALEAEQVALVKTAARIVKGDAAKVICQVADRLKPAAVVLGTRGRSLVKSVLQGSVSQYCLHHCKSAPIIVVPGKGIPR
uniref:UspA domain-containing protein n=1 Tax=Kalanchoe fedtschenkoi TaxID=63787 RepID=A0A7N0T353_KALFE